MTDPQVVGSGSSGGASGSVSEAPRATFRSAGLWMALVGWVELLAGSALGVMWLLAITGEAPWAAGSTPDGWVFTPLQAVAGIGIGILTLFAGRAFRRAAEAADGGCPQAVTEAVSALRELYERQLWVIAALVCIALGGLFLWR